MSVSGAASESDYKWKNVIIIPDIHQNVAWLERVLKDIGKQDGLVFLGDYFDPSMENHYLASPAETVKYLNEIALVLGDKAVFLLGNHDIQYLESLSRHRLGKSIEPVDYGCGASWSSETAEQVIKLQDLELFKRFELFTYCQGYLISHAGVSEAFWKRSGTTEEALASLQSQSDYAMSQLGKLALPLLGAGKSRAGRYPKGGLTWLDWETEFEDVLPIPQIVGHSKDPIGARKKGSSWCIDGNQSTYARLQNGALVIKNSQ